MDPQRVPMALMLVEGADGPPSTAAAAAQLGVRVEDIDASFGVIPVDPARALFCVQVRADRLPEHGVESDGFYRGPFANPDIAPVDGPGCTGDAHPGPPEERSRDEG